MYWLKIATPIGEMTLMEENGAIVKLLLQTAADSGEQKETPLLKQGAKELAEYFRGERQKFDLPLAPVGTEFQRKVWQAMGRIPYGEVQTYGQLAQAITKPQAVRAVGGACHANPIPIIIPCHRVVAKGGLGGFGLGLEAKKILLKIEKPNFDF